MAALTPPSFPIQVGFPLREGLPVSGQHRQLSLGEDERPDADQRECSGPSHLGRGRLCFPTPGTAAGRVRWGSCFWPNGHGYPRAPWRRLSMGLSTRWCPCGGEQVAPTTDLCPRITPWSIGRLAPAMVDGPCLSPPSKRLRLLQGLHMSISGSKGGHPLSLGLVALQLPRATISFPNCSGAGWRTQR